MGSIMGSIKTMGSFKKTAKSPLSIAFLLALTLAGCASKNSSMVYDNMAQGINNNIPAGSTQDFTVNVGDRIFFDLDSSSIRADAQQTLRNQAQWLQHYPQYTITIEGHADERGTREYNIALGQRRAVAARDYLVSLGIPANRMRTISYGKERPVAICDDITCWNQNRRAVTVVNSGAMASN